MLFGGKGCIGLDIGSSYLKVVQLKEKRARYELETFDLLPLAPELIVEGSIIDSLRLIESIKELIKKAKVKAKNAAIGISGHAAVIIRRISVSEMTEEELEESKYFEAEQYVPFDVEECSIDFQILGPSEEAGQMEVLLVAVKKDIINEYTAVVKEAGLVPVVVDVNALAIANMYEINYEIEPGRNVALVDIGASTINLNVLKGGLSVFTRDSSTGGNLYTDVLRKEFGLNYEDAERLKRGEQVEGVSPEDALRVMESASDELGNEVARSIDYFRSTAYHEEIGEVIMSGGGAMLKDFPRLLSEKTALEVRVAEPFRNIHIPKKFDIAFMEENAPMAAVAVGLALRRPTDR